MAKDGVVRLNVNIPVSLMAQLDDYADRMNINKTSAVAVLLSRALESEKTMESFVEFVKLAKAEQKK